MTKSIQYQNKNRFKQNGDGYECEIYFENNPQRQRKRKQTRLVHFPKQIMETNVPAIREFADTHHNLYYYLLWTSRMAKIDNGFTIYTFKDRRKPSIGIFNAELHNKRTNALLFVVSKPTDTNKSFLGATPLWTMHSMMTARQLLNEYGINECDLPNGCRAKRKHFESAINAQYESLQRAQFIFVKNWKKIPLQMGAQMKKKFNVNSLNNLDLNAAIRCSIEQIQREELELIPILNINNRVYCDALIPIKVGKNAWFAVQYKMATISPYRATVTGLCVDAEDILNKASLVDPNAVSAYKWILGRQLPSPLSLEDSDSIRSDASMMSVSDLTSSNTFGLAKQLQDALQREKMLTVMLMTQTQLKSSTSVRVANSVPPPSQPVDMSCISNSVILGTSMMRISSHSAPMLPMVSPNGLITPPPFMLNGGSATTQSAHTSPSFGAQQAGMQNLFDFSLNP